MEDPGLWFRETLTVPKPFFQNGILDSVVHFRRVFHSPTEPFTWMAIKDHRGRRMTAGTIAWVVCPRGHQLSIFAEHAHVNREGASSCSLICSICNVRTPHPWALDNFRDS